MQKKPQVLPAPVEFAKWKLELEKSSSPRSLAAKALQCWIERQASYRAKIGDSDGATKDSILESIYLGTRPQVVPEVDRRNQEFAANKIRSLSDETKTAIRALKACNLNIVPKDGTLHLDFTKLLCALEESSHHIQVALLYLDRPYMRSPDALSYCAWFISALRAA